MGGRASRHAGDVPVSFSLPHYWRAVRHRIQHEHFCPQSFVAALLQRRDLYLRQAHSSHQEVKVKNRAKSAHFRCRAVAFWGLLARHAIRVMKTRVVAHLKENLLLKPGQITTWLRTFDKVTFPSCGEANAKVEGEGQLRGD